MMRSRAAHSDPPFPRNATSHWEKRGWAESSIGRRGVGKSMRGREGGPAGEETRPWTQENTGQPGTVLTRSEGGGEGSEDRGAIEGVDTAFSDTIAIGRIDSKGRASKSAYRKHSQPTPVLEQVLCFAREPELS
eukprot:2423503-Rhodomonas_salina.2